MRAKLTLNNDSKALTNFKDEIGSELFKLIFRQKIYFFLKKKTIYVMFELLIKLIQTSYMENKQPFYLLITM